jgi:hypothetical protein
MMIRTLGTCVLCLFGALALAADPRGLPAISKAAEFNRIDTERSDLISKLAAIKSENANSSDVGKKSELDKKHKEGVEKVKALEVKLVAAAESAFAEAPNGDPKVTNVLVRALADRVSRDDYESAFSLGKVLMDHKCSEKKVPALAGIAGFCVNEYDLAKPWLNSAEESGDLWNVSQRMNVRMFEQFPEIVDATKADWAKEKKIRESEAKANDMPRVMMKTSAGTIEIELFENEAPNTVMSFITLVDKRFYNGLTFHRVLPAFMAQGGDPKGDGTGGPGYTIPDECFRPDHRLHFRGSLSMAHAAERDTGGSQFFIL